MIPITKLLIGEEEAQAAARVIRSGWLAQGVEVARFEQAVADLAGARHGVAVSSGTTALHLCLAALGVGPGDEVLVPALGFVATANVVRHTGARPVLVDVDPRTFNLAPERLEPAITPRTRMILPVHQLGLSADMTPILALARSRGLGVVEDGACALGAEYHGRPVGALGNPCCFSFHPRKVITTGEGGVITTDDDELADTLRALRSHGMRACAREPHDAPTATSEPITLVGYNYRMTDVQAAVGQVQIGRLAGILERRKALARRYGAALSPAGLAAPVEPAGSRHTFQSYMVLLPDHFTASQRDLVIQRLADRGISTRPGLMALHLQPAHHDPTRPALPVTEALARRGLMLPLYPELSESDQDRVVRELCSAVGELG